jgi:superfamily I DNA and/or RNA helicase
MKFTFKSKQEGYGGNPEVTVEFEADSLNDVLYYMEDFLRGSGFRFDGNLDFVTEEEYEDSSDYKVDIDTSSPIAFNWTTEQLMDNEQVFIVNPSESKSEYVVTEKGKHINLSINEEVTSLAKTICPVCKLPTATMQNYVCYDKNCGMKV